MVSFKKLWLFGCVQRAWRSAKSRKICNEAWWHCATTVSSVSSLLQIYLKIIKIICWQWKKVVFRIKSKTSKTEEFPKIRVEFLQNIFALQVFPFFNRPLGVPYIWKQAFFHGFIVLSFHSQSNLQKNQVLFCILCDSLSSSKRAFLMYHKASPNGRSGSFCFI